MKDSKTDSAVYPKPKVVIMFALGVILLLFGAVFFFTGHSFIPGFRISDKNGEIGDAINGITAPITSLIGAGLVFYSFMAQLEANKLIQAQWQYDSFTKAFNDIQNEISNLTYTKDESYLYEDSEILGMGLEKEPVVYRGSEAIIEFTNVFESFIKRRSVAMVRSIERKISGKRIYA